MEVYRVDKNFDFEKLSLANPQPVQGGSYYTKINIDSNPLYIQLPKCSTKQGVITTKRIKYSDLLYDKSNEEILINWALALEGRCQELIYEKRNLWFHQEIQKDDIETMMSPLFRLYKSGKKLLIRTYIDIKKENSLPKCVAYDENEIKVDLETIDENTTLIPLVLIEGIKFSSKSFELDIKLTQIMVLDDEPSASNICLIKNNKNVNNSVEKVLEPDNKESLELIDKSKLTDTNETLKVEENKEEENKEMHEVISEISKEVKSELTNIETLDNNDIEEVQIQVNDEEPISLKKPNEVYYEIYRAAREKAKQMRRIAVEAYLEAKNIKTKYALHNIDDSEDSEDELSDDENVLNL